MSLQEIILIKSTFFFGCLKIRITAFLFPSLLLQSFIFSYFFFINEVFYNPCVCLCIFGLTASQRFVCTCAVSCILSSGSSSDWYYLEKQHISYFVLCYFFSSLFYHFLLLVLLFHFYLLSPLSKGKYFKQKIDAKRQKFRNFCPNNAC